MREIGAVEAKNKFSQLLGWVERGEEIAITRRGKEVARLVPAIKTFIVRSIPDRISIRFCAGVSNVKCRTNWW
jgi:prevent-host-death family protein